MRELILNELEQACGGMDLGGPAFPHDVGLETDSAFHGKAITAVDPAGAFTRVLRLASGVANAVVSAVLAFDRLESELASSLTLTAGSAGPCSCSQPDNVGYSLHANGRP